MPKYQVSVDWSGYSRGCTTYLVEADSPEEAKEIYNYKGVQLEHDVIRDDTETDHIRAEGV